MEKNKTKKIYGRINWSGNILSLDLDVWVVGILFYIMLNIVGSYCLQKGGV